jgi:cytochrome c oxidase assembly protein subunit 15
MRAADQSSRFFRMALAAVGLAFAAVLFNAYARLSEAGLGCPDWPGCYGVLFAPTTAQDLKQEEPDAATRKRLEQKRDAQETVNRFIAVGLSFLLIRLTVLGWQLKRRRRGQQIWIPIITLVVTFGFGLAAGPLMAVAGSETFEYRTKPLVLMLQFLGGMITFALLWWIVMREQRFFRSLTPTPWLRAMRPRTLFALALVSLQIVLGGWSMVNHAGLACPDFPTCQGQWWPPMELLDAFTMWRDVGLDYEGRLLALPGATAIHFAHRVGALAVLLYVGWLSLHILRHGHEGKFCRYGMLVLVLLLAQTALGIMEVVAHLPIAVAVLHSAFAALSLAALVTLYHVVRAPRTL